MASQKAIEKLRTPAIFKISLKVIDISTGLPIEGAHVKILERLVSSGSVTDTNGDFSLFVFPDEQLEITHLNYESLTVKVFNKNEGDFIELYPKTYGLDEVVITAPDKKINYKTIGFGLLGLFVLKSLFYKKTKNVNL